MAGVNKVIILGNLGREPELKYTPSGTPVCRIAVATTRTWKDKQGAKQEETEWHRVSVWGKSAEHCNNYLAKGRQVYVEGRIKTSSYEQDGVKKWSTEIVADTVQFIGAKQSGASSRPARDEPETRQPGGYEDDIPF